MGLGLGCGVVIEDGVTNENSDRIRYVSCLRNIVSLEFYSQ